MSKNYPDVIRIERSSDIGACKLNRKFDELSNSIKFLDVNSDCRDGEDEELYQLLRKSIKSEPKYEDTFLKSPFDDKYFSIEEYGKKVEDAKQNHFFEICRLLGASKVKYTERASDRKNKNINFKSDFGFKGKVELDLRTDKKEDSVTVRDQKVFGSYVSVLSLENCYKKAREYAEKYNLLNDDRIQKFINGRSPDENRLKYYEETICISEEVNSKINIATDLKCLKGFIKFSSDFCQSVGVIREKKVEMKIWF